MGDEEAIAENKKGLSSFTSVFMHADAVDVALMLLGLVGAMGDGMSTPVMLLMSSSFTNDFGRGPADLVQEFSSRINAVRTGAYSSGSSKITVKLFSLPRATYKSNLS
jgi:ATP-binding cassette, subfamily B (MDR/TAP), member 1